MEVESLHSTLQKDLNEYEDWINMKWGVNKYDDDDIVPIISMRDNIHTLVKSHKKDIPAEQIQRLKELDARWQDFIFKNRDTDFRFNFSNFDKSKSQWWWWIDRMDELTEEERSNL